jgi:hypothetical protein
MAAPKGNQYWKLADPNKIGTQVIWESPEDLWEKACEYFEWCDNNPLQEEKVFHFKGEITKTDTWKMRAYTLKGLCIFLGVNEKYFNQFPIENNQEYTNVITRIRDIIFTQKFEGAAADLLNQNIVAMELGLAQKKQIDLAGELTTNVINLGSGVDPTDDEGDG